MAKHNSRVTNVGADLIKHGGYNPSWKLLILVGFVVFVTFNERITTFRFSWREFTINQQAIKAQENYSMLELLITGDGAKEILEKLLSGTVGQERDIWWRLLIYRLSLRALLIRFCNSHRIDLPQDRPPSMYDMLKEIEVKNLMEPKLLQDLDRIRDATYFIEWGAGTRPSTEDIKVVLRTAPTLLRQLESSATMA